MYIEFMHRFSYTFVHGILFTHSVLQSFTHVIHDGVHFNLLRGFSHRTLTRNFGNTNSCCWPEGCGRRVGGESSCYGNEEDPLGYDADLLPRVLRVGHSGWRGLP
jgi:hypothetical protein